MSGPRASGVHLRDPQYRTVLLVGEVNPYSEHPEHALLPWPRNAAGDRLSRILGITHRDYLNRFARINLCVLAWSRPLAEAEARRIRAGFLCPVVALGRKVAEAFGVEYRPFAVVSHAPQPLGVLPHPSGRCRVWNSPDARSSARALVEDLRRYDEGVLRGVPREVVEVA